MQGMTPSPETRQRPAVVTAAAALMLFLAVLGATWTVMSLTVIGGVREAVTEQLADQELADAASGIVTVTLLASLGFQILVLLAFVVLALFVLRGSNPARITTWVVAGLFLFCGVCGLALQGAGSFMPAGDADSEAMTRAVEEAIPGWFSTSDLVISIVQVVVLILVIVLLALPPANAFFARPVPQWQPPVEYGGQAPMPYPPPTTQPPATPPRAPEPPAPGEPRSGDEPPAPR